jgi:lipopolysaccharide transport system permease protein
MQHFSPRLREMTAAHWRNRNLIRASIKREIFGRYRGSFLGILWSFFNPLFMLAIYTLVFSEILKARWSAGSTSKAEFALILFAGLMPFNLFAETITRAPGLIVGNTNYVKKVVYPLEILPTVVLGVTLFHLAISLFVWLMAFLLFYGVPYATVVYFPLVLLPFCLFILGLSWMLASLGVYLRDVSQFIGVLTTALMFLSPIFYAADSLPESYRPLLYLNPLTPVIELSRDVLFWGKAPDFFLLGTYTLASLLIAWLGFAWFQKTRKGFADVL